MPIDSVDRRALIYNRLRRRNRFIGILRWAVPAAGLALTAGLVAQIVIANLGAGYSLEGLTIEDGKVVIDAPRYSGLFGESTRYDVAADSALVSMQDSEQVDLQDASISTVDDTGYRMDAQAPIAHLDVRAERITVDGAMTTRDSDGVTGELFSTVIDWRDQTLQSQGPVRIEFLDGSRILSETLTYRAERAVWHFGATEFTRPGSGAQGAAKITSSQLIYDETAGTAEFSGDARVEQENTQISSDTLLVHFADGETSDFDLVEAMGGVTIKGQDQTATGARGVYDPTSQVMDLIGDVKVENADGTITASQLSIDLSRSVAEFSTDGDARVHGDFNPPGADRARIDADRLVDMREENRTEFSGDTVVRMADQTVRANRFIVHYKPDGTNAIAYYEMLGSVRVRNSDQTATGERGVYDPGTRILRLTGNVQVTNASGTVNAPELRVNLATNVSEFSGPGEGNRVTGVFSPDNAPQTQ